MTHHSSPQKTKKLKIKQKTRKKRKRREEEINLYRISLDWKNLEA